LSLLWIFDTLSVGVKFNLLDASLSIRSRLCVPYSSLQLNSAQFLHSNATPTADTLGNGPQSAVTCSSKLIAECVPPALLAPAQQVRTEQSTVPFVYGRDRLLTGASRAKKRVDLVHRLHTTASGIAALQ
jgi:hypothetical protein